MFRVQCLEYLVYITLIVSINFLENGESLGRQWAVIWQSFGTHGQSLVSHWAVIGQSLDSHWTVIGPSLDSHWTVIGQSDSHRTVI